MRVIKSIGFVVALSLGLLMTSLIGNRNTRFSVHQPCCGSTEICL
jgi:hypothetical protein